jgi:hypothetical protein
MKRLLLAAITIPAAIHLHADPVDIQLPGQVMVEQPVTVVQSVPVSTVPVRAIIFDMEAQKIIFRCAFGNSGNATVELSGGEFQAIKTQFLNPFAAQVAPLLQEKLSSGQ